VSFVAIVLCVASQRVFVVVYFVMTLSGNFWIHPLYCFGLKLDEEFSERTNVLYVGKTGLNWNLY
jgi:hypothetical protein